MTWEVFCIQKKVENLLVSRETKERTRLGAPFTEKTGEKPSCDLHVTLSTLRKTLTQHNSPNRLSITHSPWPQGIKPFLLTATVNYSFPCGKTSILIVWFFLCSTFCENTWSQYLTFISSLYCKRTICVEYIPWSLLWWLSYNLYISRQVCM